MLMLVVEICSYQKNNNAALTDKMIKTRSCYRRFNQHFLGHIMWNWEFEKLQMTCIFLVICLAMLDVLHSVFFTLTCQVWKETAVCIQRCWLKREREKKSMCHMEQATKQQAPTVLEFHFAALPCVSVVMRSSGVTGWQWLGNRPSQAAGAL